jgi:hypothetical protein
MPLPDDRCRADLFKVELRRKAALDPRNTWELIWFLRLPLEVQHSYARILEARIDQDSIRQFLFRQSCYRQQDWRARGQTLDFMALESVRKPSRPWTSLGRRQRRKPAEQGRTATRRPRCKPTSSIFDTAAPTPPSRSFTRRSCTKPMLHAEPKLQAADASPRPPTPEGLRHALQGNSMLLSQASGYSPNTLQREPCLTPTRNQYEPYPLWPPSGQLVVDGQKISRTMAFLVAVGRYYDAPGQGYTLEDAAQDVYMVEKEAPDILRRVVDSLFPAVFRDIKAAAPLSRYATVVLDLVRGWSIVPISRVAGQMPVPAQRCSC